MGLGGLEISLDGHMTGQRTPGMCVMARGPSNWIVIVFKLSNPTGHVTHHQFNIQHSCTLCPHCVYVFCVYLRTNSDL
jgi:hypothetical protein